jgi:hypothetical protein
MPFQWFNSRGIPFCQDGPFKYGLVKKTVILIRTKIVC